MPNRCRTISAALGLFSPDGRYLGPNAVDASAPAADDLGPVWQPEAMTVQTFSEPEPLLAPQTFAPTNSMVAHAEPPVESKPASMVPWLIGGGILAVAFAFFTIHAPR